MQASSSIVATVMYSLDLTRSAYFKNSLDLRLHLSISSLLLSRGVNLDSLDSEKSRLNYFSFIFWAHQSVDGYAMGSDGTSFELLDYFYCSN